MNILILPLRSESCAWTAVSAVVSISGSAGVPSVVAGLGSETQKQDPLQYKELLRQSCLDSRNRFHSNMPQCNISFIQWVAFGSETRKQGTTPNRRPSFVFLGVGIHTIKIKWSFPRSFYLYKWTPYIAKTISLLWDDFFFIKIDLLWIQSD